jgi:hypothetical protein
MQNWLLSFALQSTSGDRAPDGWFYYILSIGIAGLTAFLIWFAINRYLVKQDARDTKIDNTLESINKTLLELQKLAVSHEEKHKNHEQRFSQLERKK